MGKVRKNVLLILICISSLFLASCSKEIENRLYWEVPAFTYQNHKGSKTASEDLRGKVWMANFIFTSCATVCPPMTANMAKLKDMVNKENMDVEFVSFSVNPEVDSPELLAEYGGKFSDDLSNWTFLTGYTQDEIETVARENFKMIVEKEEGNSQVSHGTYFYLIDQEGKIVRYYRGDKEVPYEEIMNHIEILQ